MIMATSSVRLEVRPRAVGGDEALNKAEAVAELDDLGFECNPLTDPG